MKKKCYVPERLNDKKGIAAVYVAIMMVIFIGFAALAVDVGYMMVARNELHNAADAAALAGARQLGQNYLDGTTDPTTVVNYAQNTGSLNEVAGSNLAEDEIDVKIGTWAWNSTTEPRFTETSIDPYAVQVTTKRNAGTTNKGINLFFASIFNIHKFNTEKTAVAALSGLCEAKPTLPLGIGRSWFTNLHANNYCTQIALNDTMSSCSGWTNLADQPYKQKDVQDILNNRNPDNMINITAGSYVEFGGGTVTPILNALIGAFTDKTWDSANKTFNADGTVATWNTSVIVFEDNDICGNPNERSRVLGFATILITGIQTTGNNKGPYGVVQCNLVESGRGGCFNGGTLGAIPNLVK